MYIRAFRRTARQVRKSVADKFDPYREALVMEINTIWPAEMQHLSTVRRAEIEAALHAAPAECAGLEYVRTHTGLCRTITVTPADVERVGT